MWRQPLNCSARRFLQFPMTSSLSLVYLAAATSYSHRHCLCLRSNIGYLIFQYTFWPLLLLWSTAQQIISLRGSFYNIVQLVLQTFLAQFPQVMHYHALSCLGSAVQCLSWHGLFWDGSVQFSFLRSWPGSGRHRYISRACLLQFLCDRMPSFIVYVLQQHASRPSALSLVLQDSFLVSRNFFSYNGLFCLQLLLVAAERAFRWNLSHLLCFFPHIFSDERILFANGSPCTWSYSVRVRKTSSLQ